MKEATGELNMTVVTVVAIAAVAAFFYAFVWPSIKSNITSATKCANATCDSTSCTTSGSKTVCSSCTDASSDGTSTDTGSTFKCSFENGTTAK